MRTKCCLVALLLLGAWANTGCPATRQPQKPEAVDPTKKLQADVDSLRVEMRSLRRRVFQLDARVSRYDSLSLDPTEKGYSRIDSRTGFFLVSVKDVKPYLDGYRVVLAIGNPTTARYTDFKLKVAWQKGIPEQREGESDEQFQKRVDQWSSSRAEKELSFTETLYPGSWNTVTVVISPATPEELKNLEITSMETDRVSLAIR